MDAQAFNEAIECWRREGTPAIVARGHFDPVLAVHARRLEMIRPAGGKLAVIVADGEGRILDARSRAELVAALRCVDLVAIGETGLPEPDARFDETDAEIAREFESHVVERMS